MALLNSRPHRVLISSVYPRSRITFPVLDLRRDQLRDPGDREGQDRDQDRDQDRGRDRGSHQDRECISLRPIILRMELRRHSHHVATEGRVVV
jgi:hypothetical protein